MMNFGRMGSPVGMGMRGTGMRTQYMSPKY